ncbi:TPA: hypothetical protein N0F65_008800 [Lagenidium giganteum]|uniref:EF-hand domain-containing protein n=1 Tax=Lagenidium giganteum TaxID=4803 RepID=A0AAV2YZE4_9STRA|nr:TPA: hypothetical protein N0F65_008800 [Lagenidium giganteum]
MKRPTTARTAARIASLCALVSAFAGVSSTSSIADLWYRTTRCDELSSSAECAQYERCKDTHRCARGNEDYLIKAARLESFDRQFGGGTRSPISLVNDFEDWKSGTHGWTMSDSMNAIVIEERKMRRSAPTLGLNTFNFTVIGSLELADGYLVFDTDKARVWGDINLDGALTLTTPGTKVAVFNFMTVYLGQNVTVRFQGSNAICIMSRSSMIIDTRLEVRPGTLGGFPGGGFVGSGPRNNNRNGPGSTNVRVYVKTISTFGTHVPEIQEIQTSCAPGQRMQGHFIVRYMGLQTQPIPYDASAYDVKRYLETTFPDIGSLDVQRTDTSEQVPEIGRLWRITFLSAVGNAPQLGAISKLTGLGSRVDTRTIRDGNELSGTFSLSFFNVRGRQLPHDINAEDLRLAMLADFPFLLDARVSRTDGTGQCIQGSTLPDQTSSNTITNDHSSLYQPSEWLLPTQRLFEQGESFKNNQDRLCSAGRGAAGGFVWKLQFWTRRGNQMPFSPSSHVSTLVDSPEPLVINTDNLKGAGAAGEVVDSLCFSLAFGGGGGTFANAGGAGYTVPFQTTTDFALIYSDNTISDLLGGSGGAGGGLDPIDIFPVVQPTLGGAGGGVIMLTAVNDILVGSSGLVSVNGGHGGRGFTAGGGGSAGTVLVTAGGVVTHHGSIQAIGGHGGPSTPSNNAAFSMPGGGGSGGRIAIYAQAFSTWGAGVVVASGGTSQDAARVGGAGSVRVQVHTALAIRVDPSVGAAGTVKSLLIDGEENDDVGRSPSLHANARQVVRNGPRFAFLQPSRPTRVAFFVRVGNFRVGTITNNQGAVFGLHAQALTGNNNEFVIATAIADGYFTHEANTFQLPRQRFQEKIQPLRWYKVDILIDWDNHAYSILLNDVLKVRAASFVATQVSGISLNNYHGMSTWWDELYVGTNHLMGFECPHVSTATLVTTGQSTGVVVVAKRPLRKLWRAAMHGEPTSFHPMVKHESHLSAREVYKHNNGDMVPFDGAPHRAFLNDVQEYETEESDGTGEEDLSNGDEVMSYSEILITEELAQDSTIVLPLETGIYLDTLASDRSSSTKDESEWSKAESAYWYSEVYNFSTGYGGIGACSTVDFVEWRNEGIMLHFVNITDPFGGLPGGQTLLADRPKVIFNADTNQFVMWMHVDNLNNTMGLSAVATSAFPNGPFLFTRSFFPDAPLESPGGQSINETHDQTIAFVGETAYLIRTYFKTVEYWLPRPVMDPLWQSVQNPDNTTNFGLNYHRAFYHQGYDNPNDIYLQRWRMEDTPWQVICCQPTNMSNCVSNYSVPGTALEICPPGMEKTKILGQSQMKNGSHLHSRYKDPNDPANSYFIPHSVPSHTTWGFQVYNVKTWRGNYFDSLSTNITSFVFHRFAGERMRLTIASNPKEQYTYPNAEELHSTFIPTNDTAILDELLGTLGVPLTPAFKDKYSSYDLAEIDVNSDGKVTSYEVGELVKSKDRLSAQLYNSLLKDFNDLKWDQVNVMDADGNGKITFEEFEDWVGLDPNLMFDQFDLDKSGYLDENELARLLWYRQLPRLDAAMILLDPSFDGRVYYSRFRDWLLQAPDYIFTTYDFDGSNSLNDFEIGLMVKDLGPYFAEPDVVKWIKGYNQTEISKDAYVSWLSATTSLLGDARDQLKIDNAVLGTGPDSLTGPLQVVERRRAKYVAISRLSKDHLGTQGLMKEIEGDFEGREALLNYFEFAEQLFGLHDDNIVMNWQDAASEGPQPFRAFLSSEQLSDRASYWNGRHWEGRPSAPALFTYGSQCLQVAGVYSSDSGCLPCLTRSPFATSSSDDYQTRYRARSHCEPQKELDAYIKAFDLQVSIQLRYQQQSVFGPQGIQPHYSPCYNQSQFFPCDVHKILDGNVADTHRDSHTRETAWNLQWEKHPNNIKSSQKIRVDDLQPASLGPTFSERFPARDRASSSMLLDGNITCSPDELHSVIGGGT